MFSGFSELVKEFALELLSDDMRKNKESASIIASLVDQSKKNESHVVEENVDATEKSDSSE